MFDHTSRYYNVPNAVYTNAEGQTVTYKQRRFLPHASELKFLSEIKVAPAERLDLIASQTLGDPEQYWRLCDCNNAMNPFDLIEDLEHQLKVPAPQTNHSN